MADDTNLTTSDAPSEAEIRIKDLSKKVKLTSEERDEKDRLLKETEAKAAEFEKERDFYASFTDLVSTNPAAKDHKDEILSKVKAGYTTEDATYAVLGKAGKLGAPKVAVVSPAGGSADTAITGSAAKSIRDMSREDMRKEILAAQDRGDLSVN